MIALIATRPTRVMSAMWAMPVTTVQKMIGAISMRMSSMNASPSRSLTATWLARSGAAMPSAMPSAMAISTHTQSCIHNGCLRRIFAGAADHRGQSLSSPKLTDRAIAYRFVGKPQRAANVAQNFEVPSASLTRAKEIPLSDRHTAMTQDVVRRRYKEEEIRQGELLQIIVALHFPVVAAAGPGDDLVLRAVELCARQGLHEAERSSTRLLAAAKLASSTAGIAGGVTPARRPPVFMAKSAD